jgi:hypothetical protein
MRLLGTAGGQASKSLSLTGVMDGPHGILLPNRLRCVTKIPRQAAVGYNSGLRVGKRLDTATNYHAAAWERGGVRRRLPAKSTRHELRSTRTFVLVAATARPGHLQTSQPSATPTIFHAPTIFNRRIHPSFPSPAMQRAFQRGNTPSKHPVPRDATTNARHNPLTAAQTQAWTTLGLGSPPNLTLRPGTHQA